MKNFFLLALFCLVGLVLQTTVFAEFFSVMSRIPNLSWLGGQTVDVVLISLLYLTLKKERWTALAWAMIVSTAAGLLGTAWSGVATAGYFVVAIFCAIARRHVLMENASMVGLFCGIAALIHGIVQLQLGQMVARFVVDWRDYVRTVLPYAVINGFFAPLVFFSIEWIDRVSGGQKHAARQELLIDI